MMVTTREFATELRGLHAKLWPDDNYLAMKSNPIGVMKDLGETLNRLMDLAAKLPKPRRHEVRVFLEEMRQWLDADGDWRNINGKEPKRVASTVLGGLMKAGVVFGDRLKRLSIDLAAWLPDELPAPFAPASPSPDARSSGAKPVDDDARHSADFASVNWYGTPYTFTTNQAACVRVLWEAWKNKTPVLAVATILEAAGVEMSQDRLSVVFRDHPAWGTLIVEAGKGRYRLNPPAHEDTPVAQR